MTMNPNAVPYHPAPRFQTPSTQRRAGPYPLPNRQPAPLDARPTANTHFAVLPDARNTPPHLRERQMMPANKPVVQPRNGPASCTQPNVIVFGTVPVAPQVANGPIPVYHGMYRQAYSIQYPQPYPSGSGPISGGAGVGKRPSVGVVNSSVQGHAYAQRYWQTMYSANAAYSSGSSQGSSVSASKSTQPAPNSSSTSTESNVPSYISYQGLPLPVCRNPLGSSPLPLPSAQDYNEREDVAKLHRLLNASSRYLLWWNVINDPYYAQCAGQRISYDEQLEPAFLESGYRDIVVVVALDCSEVKGFPTLAPEKGQRLYCFPVSAYPGSVCLHKLYAEEVLLGNSWKDEETLYITSDSKSEASSKARSISSGGAHSTPGGSVTDSPEEEEKEEGEITVEYKLDIRGVLDGIREGLRAPVSQCEWTTLTLHEKYTLASRVSLRRAEWDGLSSACNLEFLKRTLELQASLPKLQKQGDVMRYNKACDVIREAHKRLDAYAFESGFYYHEDGDNNTPVLRRNRRSKVGAADERRREPVRVIDFFPPGKTMFRGLRWMGWKPVGGLEAFFLCLA